MAKIGAILGAIKTAAKATKPLVDQHIENRNKSKEGFNPSAVNKPVNQPPPESAVATSVKNGASNGAKSFSIDPWRNEADGSV